MTAPSPAADLARRSGPGRAGADDVLEQYLAVVDAREAESMPSTWCWPMRPASRPPPSTTWWPRAGTQARWPGCPSP